MTTGVVTSVTPVRSGATLSADADSADTVLLVDDAVDFAETFEEPRFLVIGDESTPRQYIAVENDEETQQSVTLAAPIGGVGVTFEAGLPVTPWDPNASAEDKRAVSYEANVRLDTQNRVVPIRLKHSALPTTGSDTLVGASVELGHDGTDWGVGDVLGREAVVDPAAVGNPYITGDLLSNETVAHATDHTVGGWVVFQEGGWVEDSDKFVVPMTGQYLVNFNARFVTNGTGKRQGRFRKHTVLGIIEGTEDLRSGDSTVNTVLKSGQTIFLTVGDQVEFKVSQTSGADLDLRSGGENTTFSIVRVGGS